MSLVTIRGSLDKLNPTKSIYIKIPYKGIEISLSIPADKSKTSDADLRVYAGNSIGDDLTIKVFGSINYAPATAENIKTAMKWIDDNV